MSAQDPINLADQPSSLDFKSLMLFFLAVGMGIILAIFIFPFWAPHMAGSMLGQEPKVFWYLSRATAFVSMGLLWASMALGLIITNKMARIWPGGPTAFALHEYTSVLGLIFVLFHALLLLGDQYIHLSLVQILIPFGTESYKPFWIGLGQLGFYLWALITASFYVRKSIGKKIWRALHFMTFLAYLSGLLHGLATGTDTTASGAGLFYWLTGGSLIFLLIYRILASFLRESTPDAGAIPPVNVRQPSPIPVRGDNPTDRQI